MDWLSYSKDNQAMVDKFTRLGIIESNEVERAFRCVSRAAFVPGDLLDDAFKDTPLRGSYHVHMSAPHMYAAILEELQLDNGMSFLNVGSGTGYFSMLAGYIIKREGINHGVELHEDLVQFANMKVQQFLEHGPPDTKDICPPVFIAGNCCRLDTDQLKYDRLYCGAACTQANAKFLLKLVKVGGFLIAPVGCRLIKLKRVSLKEGRQSVINDVSFAPLISPTSEDRKLPKLKFPEHCNKKNKQKSLICKVDFPISKSPARRNLARMRAFQDAIDCLQHGLPIPMPFCYVPSREDSNNVKSSKKIKADEKQERNVPDDHIPVDSQISFFSRGATEETKPENESFHRLVKFGNEEESFRMDWDHISTDKTWHEIVEHYYSLCATTKSRREKCFSLKRENQQMSLGYEKSLSFKKYARKMGLLPLKTSKNKNEPAEKVSLVDDVADGIVQSLLEEVMNQVDENESAENLISAITKSWGFRRRSSVSRAMILDNLPRLKACAEERLGMSCKLPSRPRSEDGENFSSTVDNDSKEKQLLNMQQIFMDMIADIDKQILDSIENDTGLGQCFEEEVTPSSQIEESLCSPHTECIEKIDTFSNVKEKVEKNENEKATRCISESTATALESKVDNENQIDQKSFTMTRMEPDSIFVKNDSCCYFTSSSKEDDDCNVSKTPCDSQKHFSSFCGDERTDVVDGKNDKQESELARCGQLSFKCVSNCVVEEISIDKDTLKDFDECRSTKNTPNASNANNDLQFCQSICSISTKTKPLYELDPIDSTNYCDDNNDHNYSSSSSFNDNGLKSLSLSSSSSCNVTSSPQLLTDESLLKNSFATTMANSVLDKSINSTCSKTEETESDAVASGEISFNDHLESKCDLQYYRGDMLGLTSSFFDTQCVENVSAVSLDENKKQIIESNREQDFANERVHNELSDCSSQFNCSSSEGVDCNKSNKAISLALHGTPNDKLENYENEFLTDFTPSFKKKRKPRRKFTNVKMDFVSSELLHALPIESWNFNHDKELVLYLTRTEKASGHVAFSPCCSNIITPQCFLSNELMQYRQICALPATALACRANVLKRLAEVLDSIMILLVGPTSIRDHWTTLCEKTYPLRSFSENSFESSGWKPTLQNDEMVKPLLNSNQQTTLNEKEGIMDSLREMFQQELENVRGQKDIVKSKLALYDKLNEEYEKQKKLVQEQIDLTDEQQQLLHCRMRMDDNENNDENQSMSDIQRRILEKQVHQEKLRERQKQVEGQQLDKNAEHKKLYQIHDQLTGLEEKLIEEQSLLLTSGCNYLEKGDEKLGALSKYLSLSSELMKKLNLIDDEMITSQQNSTLKTIKSDEETRRTSTDSSRNDSKKNRYHPHVLLSRCRFLFPLTSKRRGIIKEFLNASAVNPVHPCCVVRIDRRIPLKERHKYPEANTVFMQTYNALKNKELNFRDVKRNFEKLWEVKFIGEGIIDQGGGFRDSLAEIADELCPASADIKQCLSVFIKTPNQQNGIGGYRDAYIPNPSNKNFQVFTWIGKLMGAAFRTDETLPLAFPPFIWKLLIDEHVTWAGDYVCVDENAVRILDGMEFLDVDSYEKVHGSELFYVTYLSDGTVQAVIENGADMLVKYSDRNNFAFLVRKARMLESSKQVKAIRDGLITVVPESLLSCLTWQDLERGICGTPEISVEDLKANFRYELDVSPPNNRCIDYLWNALASFSNEERSRFIRFVTGRKRLPSPFFISLSSSGDDSLPTASTCGSNLFLPNYSNAEIAAARIRYAINNCVSIDTDISPW